MILALAIGALHAWGLWGLAFEWVWSNLCFPKAFEQSARFPQKKPNNESPYFRGGN